MKAESEITPKRIRRFGKPFVVVIGAGFAGLEAAKRLKGQDVEVLMIDKNNFHLFQPLLYQVATAGLDPTAVAYPVRAILRESSNVHFRVADVNKINRKDQTLNTSIGTIGYDFLIVATGSETNFFGQESTRRSAHELKTLKDGVSLRNHVLLSFEKAVSEKDEKERLAFKTIVIIGGGATGVELAGAYAELVRHVIRKDFPMLDTSQIKILLLEGSSSLLPGFPGSLRDEAYRKLKRMGIKVKLNCLVSSVEGDMIHLKDGGVIKAKNIVWTAGVKGQALANNLTEDKAKNGRVKVSDMLHLPDDEKVFIAGDLSYVEPGYPLMAPVAIQQGRCAAENVLRSARGELLKGFKYKDRGMMATIGRKSAVASVYGISFKGFFAWLVWLFVHILWLIGFRNKLIALINWSYNYFTYERGVRLITGDSNSKKSAKS